MMAHIVDAYRICRQYMKNYEYHFVVDLRYLILSPYYGYGTLIYSSP